jgi:hypothetical protein
MGLVADLVVLGKREWRCGEGETDINERGEEGLFVSGQAVTAGFAWFSE